jgi:hypothetical protein
MPEVKKSKHKPSPPDWLLAHLFGFSGEDLAVNRSGYMTRRQQGIVEFGLQRVTNALASMVLGKRFKKPQGFTPIKSACGRASLVRKTSNDPRFRQTRSMNYSLFERQLVIATAPVPFNLTEAQFAALGEGLLYRVYFDPMQPARILSLERMVASCEEPI